MKSALGNIWTGGGLFVSTGYIEGGEKSPSEECSLAVYTCTCLQCPFTLTHTHTHTHTHTEVYLYKMVSIGKKGSKKSLNKSLDSLEEKSLN